MTRLADVARTQGCTRCTMTGHKPEAVYRRYAITSAADLSEGVAKLAVLHNAPASSPNVLPFAKGTIRAQSGG